MTGADFLQLSPGAAPVRGLTGWLADAIRAAIMDGRLRAGTPLPATRLLAGDLGVSRGVIVEAYQRLADEGLVSARPGAGTRGGRHYGGRDRTCRFPLSHGTSCRLLPGVRDRARRMTASRRGGGVMV